MGKLLISKKFIRKNKQLKKIQKDYLKANKKIKLKYPKAKLGKVLENYDERFVDCSNKDDKEISFDINKYSSAQILDKISSKDIRGLSGSGFPEINKIKSVLESNANEKYLIVNAVACDPGLLHDSYILKNLIKEVKEGIEVLQKCINFNNVIIASKENIPSKYPMGAEKILIKYLLGIDIGKDEVPADKGILVMNIQTVYSIYEAFYKEKSNKTRYITVGNLNNGMGEVVKVEIGQTVGEILSKTNISYESSEKIYIGMGAMESHDASLNTKISLEDNFIAFGEAAIFNDDEKCKGCGGCTRKCPMGVDVHEIIKAIDSGNAEDLKRYSIDNCIMCGTCSYFCRASKNTMRIIQSVG